MTIAWLFADERTATVEQVMTRIVTEALRERLSRLERRNTRASVEELLAIAKRAAAHVKHPHVDHAELLYDEHGLPR